MRTKMQDKNIRSKQVNFRVSQKTYDAIEKRASELGKSMSLYVNDIVVADLNGISHQSALSDDIQMIIQRLDNIEELLQEQENQLMKCD